MKLKIPVDVFYKALRIGGSAAESMTLDDGDAFKSANCLVRLDLSWDIQAKKYFLTFASSSGLTITHTIELAAEWVLEPGNPVCIHQHALLIILENHLGETWSLEITATPRALQFSRDGISDCDAREIYQVPYSDHNIDIKITDDTNRKNFMATRYNGFPATYFTGVGAKDYSFITSIQGKLLRNLAKDAGGMMSSEAKQKFAPAIFIQLKGGLFQVGALDQEAMFVRQLLPHQYTNPQCSQNFVVKADVEVFSRAMEGFLKSTMVDVSISADLTSINFCDGADNNTRCYIPCVKAGGRGYVRGSVRDCAVGVCNSTQGDGEFARIKPDEIIGRLDLIKKTSHAKSVIVKIDLSGMVSCRADKETKKAPYVVEIGNPTPSKRNTPVEFKICLKRFMSILRLLREEDVSLALDGNRLAIRVARDPLQSYSIKAERVG